jgi:hypothetical protein
MADGDRQHEPYDYRTKCIDDHEQRIRHLESNGKEQTKLFVMSEKLEGQIAALDAKNDTRFRSIEKWVDAQILIASTTLSTKQEQKATARDWNSYLISGISIFISLVLLALRALGK